MTDEELLPLIEKDGRTWHAVLKWAEKRRDDQDSNLRRMGVSERESDFYRGKASVFTELMTFGVKLDKPKGDE